MISVNGLTKSFGKVKAVDNMNFECAVGKLIALVGPNGSGKSTALKIMAGVMRPDAGTVLVDRQPVTIASVKLRERISYLPQRIEFPEQATAKEVLQFFAKLRRLGAHRIGEQMDAFGLRAFENKKVGELSGGMLQRLALAVVYLPRADLYVLDEATTNLDAEGLISFRDQTIAALESGAVVILSTHVLKEVENLAHKIAIVSNGSIVLEKRVEQFVEDLSNSRKMWITMENLSDKFQAVALDSGAERAVLNCDTITVECGEEQRIPILTALSQAGATIKEFGLHDPSLEDVYRQFLKRPLS